MALWFADCLVAKHLVLVTRVFTRNTPISSATKLASLSAISFPPLHYKFGVDSIPALLVQDSH
ncbi:hypothetical protein B0T17DRAFT_521552 [Bombardia bombarda]|uniref:Uncharacterized protein n=1 Tax=Bombardia bombarda TaxID=252184 RepID=A0AA40CGI1_9PEZI|nr:hypothetical protein B0T17DRAFT_521552 [Bombardia bombarda]